MDDSGMRRCEARTVSGRACRAWAVGGSDPPRCISHVGQRADQRQRCVARTAAGSGGGGGKRCHNWALGDGKGLCGVHAGLTRRPEKEEDYERGGKGRVGCSAVVDEQGTRCRQWAVRGSDPALCVFHGTPVHFCAPNAGRQCTARTLDGERCRRWTMAGDGLTGHDDGQPLCWLHANPDHNGRISHGYYRRIPYFSEAQSAALRALAKDESQLMGAEVALVRLKLQGASAYLRRDDLTPRERLNATRIVLEGARAVGRLLEARKKLQKGEWKPGSAGGAGYLLHRTLDQAFED